MTPLGIVPRLTFKMNIRDQIRTFNGSAVAKSIAWAFLCGYSVPFVTMVLPLFATTDYVTAFINFYHLELTNPIWLFLFFKSTLNCGISFSLGYLSQSNAFDKLKDYFPGIPFRNSTPAVTSIQPLKDDYDK